MGQFEKRIREILDEYIGVTSLEDVVEEVLNAHCDIFAIYAYSQVMAFQQESEDESRKRQAAGFAAAQGKQMVMREMWERLAFDGLERKDLTDEQYAEAEMFWQSKVEQFLKKTILGEPANQ